MKYKHYILMLCILCLISINSAVGYIYKDKHIDYTDDNSNESVIISTDKPVYDNSLSSSNVMFTVDVPEQEEGCIKFYGIDVNEINIIKNKTIIKQKNVTKVIGTYKCPDPNNNKKLIDCYKTKEFKSVKFKNVEEKYMLSQRQDSYYPNPLTEIGYDKKVTHKDKQLIRFCGNFSDGINLLEAKIKYNINSRKEFDIVYYGNKNYDYGHLDPFINSLWVKKVKLTINPGYVISDVNNFTVLLTEDNIPSDVWLNANSDGGDIRFSSDSAGSIELPREIVYFNSSSNKTEMYVKIPAVSSSVNTTFWMWYDSDSATDYAKTDTYGAYNAWDKYYVMVQHFNTPNDDASLHDSTNNIIDSQYNTGNSTGGKIGKYSMKYYQPDGEKTTYIDSSLYRTANFTVQAWGIRDNNLGTGDGFIANAGYYTTGSSRTGFTLGGRSNGYNTFYIGEGGASFIMIDTDAVVASGGWHLLVGTYDGTNAHIWQDGVKQTATATATISNNDIVDLTTGTFYSDGGSYTMNGKVDEARYSNTTRSDGWIQTDYNNENSPSTFVTAGTPETTYPNSYFKAIWDTTKTSVGSSDNKTIMLPLESAGSYDFSVYWGDGSSDNITVWNQTETSHTYTNEGVYEIKILGFINGFRFNNLGDRNKIINITQWGCLNLGNNQNYFKGCQNLDSNATDNLYVSGTTDFYSMFYGASNFNGNISGWDVSKVTNLGYTFYDADKFNQSLNGWDTSSVTLMSKTFRSDAIFNGNISNWNTSKVTNMDYMFENADGFNQNLNRWDTSKVTTFYAMFQGTAKFNGNISEWNTSSATNMRYMFTNTIKFNQDINDWDVSNVISMDFMFENADSFNRDLNNWDTSSVTNMRYMFMVSDLFNGNISNWNTSKVTRMDYMFYNAPNFNQDVGSWDVSKVYDMSAMFQGTVFNQDISGWDTSSATEMNLMFKDDTSFDQNISRWNVSKVTDMTDMFNGITLSTANYDSLLIGWTNLPYLQNLVPFSAGGSQYCLGESARNDTLIGVYNWTITDGGKNASCGGNTCSCPSTDTNWNIDCGDYCNIDNCDIGTGNLTLSNAGYATVTGTFNLSNILSVNNGCTLYVNSTGVMNIV